MTPRQKEIFDFIQSYINNRGFAPTYKEIMQATDIRYKSQCFGLLKNLEQQGKITIDKAKARGISICKETVREKAKIKKLEKQLEIAKEALHLYKNLRGDGTLTNYQSIAINALEEIGCLELDYMELNK